MTNAELQIAIDAIRNATADGSVTNVMEADIFDALSIIFTKKRRLGTLY